MVPIMISFVSGREPTYENTVAILALLSVPVACVSDITDRPEFNTELLKVDPIRL